MEMGSTVCLYVKVQKSMFKVACKSFHLLPGALFQGPGLGRVDKHTPGSTPSLPTGRPVDGFLRKSQALVSPGSGYHRETACAANGRSYTDDPKLKS